MKTDQKVDLDHKMVFHPGTKQPQVVVAKVWLVNVTAKTHDVLLDMMQDLGELQIPGLEVEKKGLQLGIFMTLDVTDMLIPKEEKALYEAMILNPALVMSAQIKMMDVIATGMKSREYMDKLEAQINIFKTEITKLLKGESQDEPNKG